MSQNKEKPASATNSRWWEFYAVRYAMGTVVGAIAFFYLTQKNGALKPLLLLPNDGSYGIPQLIISAAFGLTFCYVASAPILVLHASRFLINFEDLTPKKHLEWLGVIFLLEVPALSALYLSGLEAETGDASKLPVNFLVFFTLIFFAICQLYLITRSVQLSKKNYSFYRKLADQRCKESSDIIDSYRHLREHGNSFGIVLLEVVLASVLATIGDPHSALGSIFASSQIHGFAFVLLVWITPAAMVWVSATALESHFAKGEI